MTPLESELTALAAAIAYPVVSADFAVGIEARLEQEPRRGPSWWQRLRGLFRDGEQPARRPLRRALVLAVILLLVLAAIATAIGLGLPGIRIVFGPGPNASPVTPPPGSAAPSPAPGATTPGPLGSDLGLGVIATPFDAIETRTGFKPRLPDGLGQPAASYVRDRRLTMVWPPSPTNPEIAGTGVGLLVTEFQGTVDSAYYEKSVNAGTTLEAVTVDGHRGYWISGEPHELFYTDPNGNFVDEARRIVGRVLIWADADLTYRLETSLSKNEAIALAESIH
jgi:hypothetical protein